TAAICDITPSPDTVSRLRKLPSRIASRAASSRFSAAVSTVVVPPRPLLALLRDCPPFARVFVPRVAAPDSTVSLPQGSTVTAVLGYHRRRTCYYCVYLYYCEFRRPYLRGPPWAAAHSTDMTLGLPEPTPPACQRLPPHRTSP